MYVCLCNKVTDGQIRAAREDGAHSLECLQTRLKVATCCGRCSEFAEQLLEEDSPAGQSAGLAPGQAHDLPCCTAG
jgi:bacterioferritin-associated ferredoxin